MKTVDTSQERVEMMEGACKDETAYIVTCGPSLTTHDREELLKKLEGRLVIACKQSYEYVKEVADFHLISVYNYQPYDYYSNDTIVQWQLTAMNIDGELSRIQQWGHKKDLLIPVFSTPWVDKQHSTAYTRDFKNWEEYGRSRAIWGPGIMYETGFPLALHLGVKRIVTIGWDIGDLSKYPSEDRMAFDGNWQEQHATDLYQVDVGSGPEYEELLNTVECTAEMYDYFKERGIQVDILSETNPADDRFNRITLDEL